MNNLTRFFLGLGALFIGIIIALIVGLLISPFFLIGGILIWIILSIIGILTAIGSFFVFMWYLTRKEPELGKDTDYSLDQGKDI